MGQKRQRDIIQRCRETEMPRTGRYSINKKGDVARMTLMADAVDGEDLSADSVVTQRYFESEGVVVIDLAEVADE